MRRRYWQRHLQRQLVLVDPGKWCYASDKALHVGVGSGAVGFEIARTNSSSAGTSQDISVDFETELGAGGFTVGASVGFYYGYTYTVDTSESYSFAGQVGDLPRHEPRVRLRAHGAQGHARRHVRQLPRLPRRLLGRERRI